MPAVMLTIVLCLFLALCSMLCAELVQSAKMSNY